ncbi:MAG: tetratricopeptide repeat protein [Acidobacteriota bacterium]
MLSPKLADLAAAALSVCLLNAQEPPRALTPTESFALRMIQANRLRLAAKFPEAEKLYLEMVKESESFPAVDVRRPKALNNLAALYHTTGRLDEAEKLYLQALPLYEFTTGENSPDASSCLNNLGEVHRLRGDFAEAGNYFKRALEAREHYFRKAIEDLGYTLNSQGALMTATGNLAAAAQSHERARDLQERYPADSSLPLSASLNNLAEVYRRMGRPDEAEKLFRRALEIREINLGPLHPDVAVVLNNLSVLLRERKDPEQAESYMSRAAAIWMKITPGGHPLAIPSLINYGEMLAESGLTLRSEGILLRALEMCPTYVAPNHEYITRAKNDIGLLHLRMGKAASAEKWFNEALAAAQSNPTANPKEIRAAEAGIVSAVSMQGRKDDAMALNAKFGLALK